MTAPPVLTRRRLASVGALAFAPGVVLTPRQARAAELPLRVLDEAEARTLSAFGEACAPGAAEAGIAQYVDHQLAAAPPDSLLMIRYLDIPPPWTPLYKAALAAIDGFARGSAGKRFADLPADDADRLVGLLAANPPGTPPPEHWPGNDGPPAGLAYFVLRADAIDVVWGTEEGFEKLGVPYMPHIAPPTRW